MKGQAIDSSLGEKPGSWSAPRSSGGGAGAGDPINERGKRKRVKPPVGGRKRDEVGNTRSRGGGGGGEVP